LANKIQPLGPRAASEAERERHCKEWNSSICLREEAGESLKKKKRATDRRGPTKSLKRRGDKSCPHTNQRGPNWHRAAVQCVLQAVRKQDASNKKRMPEATDRTQKRAESVDTAPGPNADTQAVSLRLRKKGRIRTPKREKRERTARFAGCLSKKIIKKDLAKRLANREPGRRSRLEAWVLGSLDRKNQGERKAGRLPDEKAWRKGGMPRIEALLSKEAVGIVVVRVLIVAG